MAEAALLRCLEDRRMNTAAAASGVSGIGRWPGANDALRREGASLAPAAGSRSLFQAAPGPITRPSVIHLNARLSERKVGTPSAYVRGTPVAHEPADRPFG